MINNNQLKGGTTKDPNKNSRTFLGICSTFKYTEDYQAETLFFFTKDRANECFFSQRGTIFTHACEQMAHRFFEKHFLPFKIAKVRIEITNFRQFDDETTSNA